MSRLRYVENADEMSAMNEDLRSRTREYLKDFVFFYEKAGRSFTLTVEEIDWMSGQFVTTESQNGEVEFFTTYEIKNEIDAEAFFDDLLATGLGLGAEEALSLIRGYARQVDRTSAKMVGA